MYPGISIHPTVHSSLFLDELTKNIIPFWMRHSIDSLNGGYFTCLDRKGVIYDTDKFIWLQGRQVYMFSYLYNNLTPDNAWLNIAKNGANFLEKYGRDSDGHWYFSLNQKGVPLVQAYNIFSDCFATMAFSSLYKATKNEHYAAIAKTTFLNILNRKNNPKGIYNKSIHSTRPLSNFSLPMILSNMSHDLQGIVDEELINNLLDEVITEILDKHYHQDTGLILENVLQDGAFSDSYDGRLLNPGHALEAMWFLMDIGEKRKDKNLIERAANICLTTIEKAWDIEYGGIYYFLDVLDKPLQQLEWDQKLWWVHIESMIAFAKAYQHTGDIQYLNWYNKIHDYTWSHFRDEEFGEWFGYLNRRGEVLLDIKGGKWKGCFHIPRGLFHLYKTFQKIETNKQSIN